jgi:hypothetical protein
MQTSLGFATNERRLGSRRSSGWIELFNKA